MKYSKNFWLLLCFIVSELDANKKQAEQDRKAIDELVRERDILNKVWLEMKRVNQASYLMQTIFSLSNLKHTSDYFFFIFGEIDVKSAELQGYLDYKHIPLPSLPLIIKIHRLYSKHAGMCI